MKNNEIITACEQLKRLINENRNGDALEIIHALQTNAKNETRSEKAKTNGKKTIYDAATRILKSAAAGCRDALKYAYNDGENVNICDGYRLIQFNASGAPDLPALPSKLEYPDVTRVISPATENADAVILPALNDLKNYIKIEKAKKRAARDKNAPLFALITEKNNTIYVNAEYLRDVLECLPGATARASIHRPLSGIYFESANGRGLLLPVRKTEGGAA